MLLLVTLLAACRSAQVDLGPQVAATATATPRSTPLPPVATVVPPGTEGNPIRMIMNSASSVTPAQIESFEEALREQSDLIIEVVVVERYAEALAALCASIPTDVVVAWLDGISYEAAVAQNCGEPIMQVEKGRTSRTTGDAGQMIAASGRGLSSVQSVRGRTFCRLGLEDYYSWLVPVLMLYASGLNPVNDLETVLEYDSRNELIQAIIEGECDATGISETDYEALRESQREELTVLETTPDFPYAVLMYPLSLPLGERIRLDNALLALENDREGSAALRPLLGQDGLVRVNAESLEEITEFLQSTRLDFAQLGS